VQLNSDKRPFPRGAKGHRHCPLDDGARCVRSYTPDKMSDRPNCFACLPLRCFRLFREPTMSIGRQVISRYASGISIAVGFLIQGSYELGFPTYSVLAGLGVGGLAVALAARDSLANLLGSMLIMMFRFGHYGQGVRR
jgi:small-conductance mechanosensitive channel